MEITTRYVRFSPRGAVDSYDAIGQPDYLVALTMTPEDRILLAHQFRPAIKRFSLELPAGMIEPGETPGDAISRELLEETGYPEKTVKLMGTVATCASSRHILASWLSRSQGALSSSKRQRHVSRLDL